jgi:hypothetical protein
LSPYVKEIGTMVTSNLILHRGARLVGLDELRAVKAPPAEGRWHPVAHGTVLQRVTETLAQAGYGVLKQSLALSRGDHRFFGTLDLSAPLAAGVSLAVGVRNSTDKSFPLGFCAGNRVTVCDNLAFRSELLVRKKHTLNGQRRFAEAIGNAVARLADFKRVEAERVRLLQTTEVSPELADSLILRAFERGIISTPALPLVLREWREPSFEEFRPRTAWSLLNAFTTALGDRAKADPHKFAVQTMRLNHHLLEWKPTDAEAPTQTAP